MLCYFEVWGRQFLLEKGGKVKPGQSDLFIVFFRVPTALLEGVITTAHPGVYLEPRQDGQRGHHEDYRVVWLNRCTFQQALHHRKVSNFAINLVRNRDRYGLQVLKKDESKAWKEVRPDEEFKDIRIQEIYEIAPVPHGTSKQMISELLSEWGWSARPMQPGQGSMHHMSWKIGTDQKPPRTVLRGFDQDILVTPVKQAKPWGQEPSHIASWKTQAHIKSGSSSTSSADPWQQPQHDPWMNFKPTTQAAVVAQKDRSYINAITESIKEDLQEQLRKQMEGWQEQNDQDMHVEDDGVVATLQGSVNELKAQNAQFQQWFQDASTKIQEVENVAKATQANMQQQHNEINTLRSEIQQSNQQTLSQVQAAVTSIKRDIVTELAETTTRQFSQLEALMEKKFKTGTE